VSGYREKPTWFDCYVGACLRASRMAYGWSLAEAAARSGVLAVNLQAWETGRRSCSLETLEVLARFYHARVTDFLPCGDGPPSSGAGAADLGDGGQVPSGEAAADWCPADA